MGADAPRSPDVPRPAALTLASKSEGDSTRSPVPGGKYRVTSRDGTRTRTTSGPAAPPAPHKANIAARVHKTTHDRRVPLPSSTPDLARVPLNVPTPILVPRSPWNAAFMDA